MTVQLVGLPEPKFKRGDLVCQSPWSNVYVVGSDPYRWHWTRQCWEYACFAPDSEPSGVGTYLREDEMTPAPKEPDYA